MYCSYEIKTTQYQKICKVKVVRNNFKHMNMEKNNIYWVKKSAENEKISWFYDRFGMCTSRAFQRGIAGLCSVKN